MKWPPAPPGNVEGFTRATARLRGVEARKMFGYPAAAPLAQPRALIRPLAGPEGRPRFYCRAPPGAVTATRRRSVSSGLVPRRTGGPHVPVPALT